MKRSLLCAVAALGLLTGTAFAQNAERPGAGGAEAPGGAGGEQRLPPGGAPKGAPGGAGKMPGATGGNPSPGMKPAPGAEAQPGQRQKGENAGVSPKAPDAAGDQMRPKAEDQGKPGQKAGEAKPGAEAGKPAAQAGRPAGAGRPAPRLTETQTTQVRTAFRNVRVEPVRVDFRVNVGIAVPRTVVLEPVPREIVTIVPEYEGFRFFEVPGEIVIVDPDTLEIVYILPL